MDMMHMQMTFNGTSAYVPYLLFKKWTVNGWLPRSNSTDGSNHGHLLWWQSMINAVIVIFLLGVLTEVISFLRVHLHRLQRSNPLKRALEASQRSTGPDVINHDESVTTSSTSLLAPLRIPSSIAKIKRRRFNFHIAQSFLYMIYRFSGYLLMLATMTFNMYIFLAAVLGLGVGYFFLAPIRLPSKEGSAVSQDDSPHAHGSRHGGGRGRGGLTDSGSHGYSYGSL